MVRVGGWQPYLVHPVHIDAEERIRQKARLRRVREVEIDKEGGEQGEEDVPAEVAAANISVLRPDNTVVVEIPIFGVLLDYL